MGSSDEALCEVVNQCNTPEMVAHERDAAASKSSTSQGGTNSLRFKSTTNVNFWGKCADQKCPSDGKPMVDNDSVWVGCVCNKYGCPKKTWAQFNLCRRACLHGDSGMCAQCFPSEARVTARTPLGQQVTRRMEELQVGDEVLTSGGFSPIFAFMDHTAETKGDYVRLHTTSGATVSASADHIIFAHETRDLVMAGSIKVGDTLWVHSNATVVGDALAPAVVVRVEQTEERGLHAPLTKDGSIIVDGVLASSYAKSASLTWGTSTTLVTGHALNMFMHAPLRFACEVSPSLCGPEWHIATSGRHQFTEWILTNFGWLQKLNAEHADLAAAMFGEDATPFSIAAALVQLAAAAMLAAAYYGLFAWHPAQALAIVATSVVSINCVRRNKSKVE